MKNDRNFRLLTKSCIYLAKHTLNENDLTVEVFEKTSHTVPEISAYFFREDWGGRPPQ